MGTLFTVVMLIWGVAVSPGLGCIEGRQGAAWRVVLSRLGEKRPRCTHGLCVFIVAWVVIQEKGGFLWKPQSQCFLETSVQW